MQYFNTIMQCKDVIETSNETTKKAIENVRNNVGLSRSFSSVKELMEDFNADD